MVELSGRRMLILGLGATGLAVATAGHAAGALLFAYDDNSLPSLQDGLDALQVRLLSREEASREPFDLCIASPGIPPDNKTLNLLLNKGISVISEIELAYQLSSAPIAAVTGTNGKSTTTVLTGKMIEASGRKAWIGGNLSAEGYDLPLITAATQSSPEDVLVAEVSSFQLERSFQFRPRAAALLNVTEDHLNRYADVTEYAAAKGRIFQAQQPDDFAILGADDPVASSFGTRVRSRVLWFSGQQEVEQGAFLRGENMVLRADGSEHAFARTTELGLWASYDRLNVLAAACAAWAMGATIEGIRTAAVSFTGLPHRMESCGTVDGVLWLNNSMCTNPAAGLAAVRAVAERYPAVVIAGGAGKNCGVEEWGRAVAQSARSLLLIGKDSDLLGRAAREGGLRDVRFFESLEAAMKEARRLARPGDAVVLAPAMASFDQFSDFRDRGRKFKGIVESFRTEAES